MTKCNLIIWIKHQGKLEFELNLGQVMGFINDLNQHDVVRLGPFIFKSSDFIRGEFYEIKEND